MAIEGDIGGDDTLFVGEDKTFILLVVDADGVPIDTSGWVEVRFVVRKKDKSADPAIFDKVAARSGVYNVNPSLNTERWTVQLTDDDMNLVRAKTYRYSWKLMDDGRETILRFGNFAPQQATAR